MGKDNLNSIYKTTQTIKVYYYIIKHFTPVTHFHKNPMSNQLGK